MDEDTVNETHEIALQRGEETAGARVSVAQFERYLQRKGWERVSHPAYSRDRFWIRVPDHGVAPDIGTAAREMARINLCLLVSPSVSIENRRSLFARAIIAQARFDGVDPAALLKELAS
jgi:hypothetical protein